jgi:hypothetical protein
MQLFTLCICVFVYLPCHVYLCVKGIHIFLRFCYLSITFFPPFLLSFHYIFPSVSAIFPLHFSLRFCYLSITFSPPFLLSFHYIFSSVSAIFPLHFSLRFCYLSITFWNCSDSVVVFFFFFFISLFRHVFLICTYINPGYTRLRNKT